VQGGRGEQRCTYVDKDDPHFGCPDHPFQRLLDGAPDGGVDDVVQFHDEVAVGAADHERHENSTGPQR
jgi:hypothetical protein